MQEPWGYSYSGTWGSQQQAAAWGPQPPPEQGGLAPPAPMAPVEGLPPPPPPPPPPHVLGNSRGRLGVTFICGCFRCAVDVLHSPIRPAHVCFI